MMKKKIVLLSLFLSCLLFGLLLLFPGVRQFIMEFAENYLIHRELRDKNAWHRILLSFSVSLSCMSIGTFFVYVYKDKLTLLVQSEKMHNTIIIILLCLYSCMLIIFAHLSNAVWLDEVYSIQRTKLSLNELIIRLTTNVHTPFYFLILRAGTLIFGDSVAVMKMVSVFPVILMAIFATLFLKKEFSDKAAIIFLLSCMASATITHYATEIRLYSWGLFFITMMAVSAWYFFKHGKKRWWTALLLCAVCGAYTHTWTMAAAAIAYALLFLFVLKYKRERIIPMIILAVAGIILYLPWFFVVLRQFSRASESFWIGPITLSTIRGYFLSIFSAGNNSLTYIFCFLFTCVLVFFLVKKKKEEKDIFVLGCLICAILLFLTGILLSITVRPLFVSRYAVPVYGLIWLFFSVGCASINKNSVYAIICIFLIFTGIFSYSLSVRNEIAENNASNEFYNFVAERIQPDDNIVVVSSSIHIPIVMNYLFPAQRHPAIVYESTQYDPDIYNNSNVWTIVHNTENTPENMGEFLDTFRYNYYRFDLYRNISMPDKDDK